MEYITDAIEDYISLEKTDYALMINGEWGSGKTHYIKTNLLESNGNENIQFCYVSLNGFSSVDQIGEAVFFELAGTKNKIAVQGAKIIGSFGAGITSFFAEGAKETITEGSEGVADFLKNKLLKDLDLSKVVICFDDLERIDSSLSIQQVFGYINSNYIEHQHSKVIFVCYEKEIEKKKENYPKIKEKIIGKTLSFTHSNLNIIENIINSKYKKETNFKNFFHKEKNELLIVIPFVLKNMNLRTLRFVFDTFVVLQKEMYTFINNESDHQHLLSKALFLNVLIIGNEYKTGELRTINQISFAHKGNFAYYFPSEEAKDEYARQFTKRYRNTNDYIDENIIFFPSVSNYIINGYKDNKNFKIKYNSWIKTKQENEMVEINYDPFKILHDFQKYDENKVKHAQETVLKAVKKGEEYSAREYLSIYRLFLMFKNENLVLATGDEDIDNVFRIGFDKALEKISLNEEDEYMDFINNNQTNYLDMMDKIKKKVIEIKYQESKLKVDSWLKKLENGSTIPPSLHKYILNEKALFQILLDLEFINHLFHSCVSNLFYEFTNLIQPKYINHSSSYQKYLDDIPYFKQFITEFDNYLSNYDGGDRVKDYSLNKLNEKLLETNKHFDEQKKMI